jgi:hypothetical protein
MTKRSRTVPEIDEQALLKSIAEYDFGSSFLNHPTVQKQQQAVNEEAVQTASIDTTVTNEQSAATVPDETIVQADSSKKISGKQRKSSLEGFKQQFMQTSKIDDRKPVFISLATRDSLDRIIRLFGERGLSVSGLMENLARNFLETYRDDVEQWRKM